MEYKDLKDIIQNDNSMDKERLLILLGYIDYCELNNTKISEVVNTINQTYKEDCYIKSLDECCLNCHYYLNDDGDYCAGQKDIESSCIEYKESLYK